MENKNIKILIIDDIQDNLTTFQALIKEAFPESSVFQALNGLQGIEIAKKEDPDVILLDIVMPGMDGFEVCHKLKEDKELREIPVVFITALKGDKESRIKALECGAEAFLAKPIDIYELTAQIQSMVKIRIANKQRRNENERLAELVERKTKELLKENKEKEKRAAELVIANKELQRSEEKFQLLFNKAPLGYQSLDSEGRFIEVNQQWIDTLEYTREEVIGKWFGDFICPEYVESFKQRFHVFKSQGYIHSEFEMLKKSGERIYIAFEGKVGYCADGEFKQTHCILQNITQQRKAEKALIESEIRFRTIFEQAPLGMALVDSTTRQIYDVNSKYADIVGRTKKEVMIQDWVSMTHPDDVQEDLDNMVLLNARKIDGFVMQKRYFKPDGSIVWINMTIAKTDVEHTNPRHLCMIEDITEFKMAQEEIIKNSSTHSAMIANISDVIGILGEEGVIKYKSPNITKYFGYSPQELVGRDSLITVHPDDKEYIESVLIDLLGKPNEKKEVEYRYLCKNGTFKWVQLSAVNLIDDPNINGILINYRDVSERKDSENRIKESEEKYRLLYSSMNQGLALHEIITDVDGKPVDYVFLDINDSYTRLLGVTREMCIGKRITEVMPKVEQYWIDIFGKVALTGEPSYYENYLETTGRYYSTYTYSPKKRQFAVLVSDMTEQKKYQEKLMYMSYHDHLTGLYNRRFFEEELSRLDTKRKLPLTIIMGDINGLKIINDSFGHAIGDEYIKKTSELIKEACREDDIVARLGGDEFAVILPNADTSEAIKIIERIKDMIAETNIGAIELSISFGFAAKESERQSVLETLVIAENYMYTHKTYERASMRSKTIDLIMNTLFEKSDRESQHSKRVSAICEAIASNMNFNQDDVNQIKIAGLVHDIGKIGIKEEILNKAGSLDNAEWAEMKRHSEAGWRILSTTAEFAEISQFVLRHHERWDGSGYPNGLKGEEIPLEARIIVVADAYDAMTSERTYKNAYSKDEAINELKRCSGTHFDPEIVEVFVNQILRSNINFHEEENE